jgi:hypothetical protein
MLIIEKRVAEFLWGKAILDAQETVLTPELIDEIQHDRALAIRGRLAREHEKRLQQAPLTPKEKRAAHDELVKIIGKWEELITNCERPSYGYQWSDYAQDGWDEFLFGCPWPAELRDRLAQLLLSYQNHSTVSPEWLARIEATDQRFRNLSMVTALSKEEMFELSPIQLPLDPDTQWYYYWQAKDYPDILKGISWAQWFFNHHDPYEFPFLGSEQAQSVNPEYVRFSWNAWKAGKYAPHAVDWDEMFGYHRRCQAVTELAIPWRQRIQAASQYEDWENELMCHPFKVPARVLCNDWAGPVVSIFDLARRVQERGMKLRRDFGASFSDATDIYPVGSKVVHIERGFGTVVDVNEECGTIDVEWSKNVIATYKIDWVWSRKTLLVLEPKDNAA